MTPWDAHANHLTKFFLVCVDRKRSTILLVSGISHPLFNTMYTRFLVIIGLLVGASAGSLRTHDKPLDKLSDEELGAQEWRLDANLLKKYKKRVTQLKASLDSLMALVLK